MLTVTLTSRRRGSPARPPCRPGRLAARPGLRRSSRAPGARAHRRPAARASRPPTMLLPSRSPRRRSSRRTEGSRSSVVRGMMRDANRHASDARSRVGMSRTARVARSSSRRRAALLDLVTSSRRQLAVSTRNALLLVALGLLVRGRRLALSPDAEKRVGATAAAGYDRALRRLVLTPLAIGMTRTCSTTLLPGLMKGWSSSRIERTARRNAWIKRWVSFGPCLHTPSPTCAIVAVRWRSQL